MTDAASGRRQEFALLLIDVQEDFRTDEIDAAFPRFGDNVARLVSFCRESGIEIVHLRAGFRPDRSDWMVSYLFRDRIPCIEGTPGARILGCAAEMPGEKVIVKQTFDGFLNPELGRHLQAGGKRFLLVAGLVTSVCVLLTAAAAAQRGYLVGLVGDCCADLPAAHDHTLGRYPFVFRETAVDKLDEDLAAWAEDLRRLDVTR